MTERKNLILVVDSSLKGVTVGIYCGHDRIAYDVCFDSYQSSSYLPQAVQSCLDSLSLKVWDLATVVCAHGPGSFTGIKVGIAFCQGLVAGVARERAAPRLVGASAMAAFEPEAGSLCILPATKTQGYSYEPKSEKHGVVKQTGQGFDSVAIGLVHLLLPWPEWERWAELQGTKIHQWDYEAVAARVSQGLARAESPLRQAFYLRNTAVEDQLDEKSAQT